MTMRTLPRRLAVAVVVAVIVAFLSIKLNAFRDYQIAEIAIEVTAVAGLTMLTGLSGQISLGNSAFMAIGAYTAALLLLHLNWPFYLVLVIAAAVTAVAGAIVGIAAARLHGPYLAGATLLLGVALPSVALAYPGVFGGEQGLNVVFNTPAFLGVNFPPTRWQAWVTAAVALVVLVLLANLTHSRIGRNWRAVRDNEVAAALDGINVAAARVRAFVVSAASAGLAGALAIIVALVAPTQLSIRVPGTGMRTVSQFLAARERPGDAVIYPGSGVPPWYLAYPDGLGRLRDIWMAESGPTSARLYGVRVSLPVLEQREHGICRIWAVEMAPPWINPAQYLEPGFLDPMHFIEHASTAATQVLKLLGLAQRCLVGGFDADENTGEIGLDH